MSRLGLTLLFLLGACKCTDPLPAHPSRPAAGQVVIVEAARPEGGGTFTATDSDLTVPPREADLGWWVDLALDSKGRPHLTYTDAFNGELHYAAPREGGGFDIVRVDWFGPVGKYTALHVDGSDRPHVLYYNQENKRLYYATRIGLELADPEDRRRPHQAAPDWLFEVVDAGEEIGMASEITVDPDGSVHAFYYANDERFLHAFRPAAPLGEHALWRREVVDAKAGGSHSITVGYARGPDGTRHLSYAHWTVFDSHLRYARLEPGADAWAISNLTEKTNAGWKSGLFLDDARAPAIVFLTLLDRRLWLARPDGEGWRYQALVGDANALAVARAPTGRVVLAYEHLPEAGLGGAKLRLLDRPNLEGDLAAGWTLHVVGDRGAVSNYLALAVDESGVAHAAMYDGGIRGVKLYSEAH